MHFRSALCLLSAVWALGTATALIPPLGHNSTVKYLKPNTEPNDCVVSLDDATLRNLITALGQFRAAIAETPEITDEQEFFPAIRASIPKCNHQLQRAISLLTSIRPRLRSVSSCERSDDFNAQLELMDVKRDGNEALHVLFQVQGLTKNHQLMAAYREEVSQLLVDLRTVVDRISNDRLDCPSPRPQYDAGRRRKPRDIVLPAGVSKGKIDETFRLLNHYRRRIDLIHSSMYISIGDSTRKPSTLEKEVMDNLPPEMQTALLEKHWQGLVGSDVDAVKYGLLWMFKMDMKLKDSPPDSPWQQFLASKLQPIMLEVLRGKWFNLKSGHYKGEYLCYTNRHKVSELNGLIQRATASQRSSPGCQWQLLAVPNTDGTFLYLLNGNNQTEGPRLQHSAHKVLVDAVNMDTLIKSSDTNVSSSLPPVVLLETMESIFGKYIHFASPIVEDEQLNARERQLGRFDYLLPTGLFHIVLPSSVAETESEEEPVAKIQSDDGDDDDDDERMKKRVGLFYLLHQIAANANETELETSTPST